MFLLVLSAILFILGLVFTIAGKQKMEDGTEIPFRGMGATAIVVSVVLFLISTVSCVGPGKIAVQTVFGEVQETTLHEGLNFKAPWANVHTMSLRQQVQHLSMNASTSTGVTVDVTMSIVYRLDPQYAARIYQSVGENYYEVLIAPFLNRTAKNCFVCFEPEALYTTERATVNLQIEDSLRTQLAPMGIIVERVPIDNIDLPLSLRDAIVAKQEAEQAALQMEYVLQRQTQESDRMRIEAQGIADYQDIVSSNLTPELLQWRAIEVTRSLAESNNTTFVIVGNTDSGLPMIMQP